MKIKKVNTKNSYQIVVDDPIINKIYGYSQKDPLVLAHLFSYSPTQWKLQDCRLFRKAIPLANTYVQNTINEYESDNEKRLQLIIGLAELKIYKINGKTVTWSTFEGIIDNNLKDTQKIEPVWNFKDGQNKLKELYDFWQNYSDHKIEILENNLLQPHKDVLFMINFLIKEFENNHSIKSEEQLSSMIDYLKKEYWSDTSISVSNDTAKLLNEYFQIPILNNELTKKNKL